QNTLNRMGRTLLSESGLAGHGVAPTNKGKSRRKRSTADAPIAAAISAHVRVLLFPPHRTTESNSTIRWSPRACQNAIAGRRAGSASDQSRVPERSQAIQSTTCAHAFLFRKPSISVVRRTRADGKQAHLAGPSGRQQRSGACQGLAANR